jgi:hypothetical protein
MKLKRYNKNVTNSSVYRLRVCSYSKFAYNSNPTSLTITLFKENLNQMLQKNYLHTIIEINNESVHSRR